MALNNIKDKDTLSIGQIVKIYQDNLSAADYAMHIVKKGDTLWSIAKEYKLAPSSLILANNLRNSELISIGQVMKIPSHTNTIAGTNIVSQAVTNNKNNNNMNKNISQPENTEPIRSIAKENKLATSSLILANNLRNEELIDLAEQSDKWREGTAGKSANPETRITDIHDLDPETEDVVWWCPVCRDNGYIRNWKGTLWDFADAAEIH